MKNRKRNWFAIIIMLIITLGVFSCRTPIDNTANIPGDINAFDPVAAIPKVAVFAGKTVNWDFSKSIKGVVLLSIEARLIRPNGTMDIEAEYKPTARYKFLAMPVPEKEKKERSTVPLGAQKEIQDTVKRVDYVQIFILKPEKRNVREAGYEGTRMMKHAGMEKVVKAGYRFSSWEHSYRIGEVASPPLSFSLIWQKAIEQGAPSENAVANIFYDVENGYTFEIEQTDYKYTFNLKGDFVKGINNNK